MPFVDSLHPQLTTVRIPHYAIGTQAAELVLERIFLSDVPLKSIFLPTELIVRGSTAPPGGDWLPADVPARAVAAAVGD
jgi:LacI family transcriptional regulator